MTVREFERWSLYFCGVASMRFHPRNDDTAETVAEKVMMSAAVADLMLAESRKRDSIAYRERKFGEG